MAYYNSSNDLDEDEVDQAGQPVSTSQASGTVGTGSGSESVNAASGAGTSSSSAASNVPTFAGINDYINANKTQANRLGQQLSSNVENQASTARQGITSLQDEANQKVQGTQAVDPDLFNQIGQAEQLSQEQRDQIRNTSNAQYKGPQDYTQLEGFNDASKNLQSAQSALGNTQTEAGRTELLNQMSGNKNRAGINTFDAALLSTGTGRQQLEDVANRNKDLGEVFNKTTGDITSQIGRMDDPNTPEDESAGAMGQTATEAARTRQAIQQAMQGWTESFNPKVESARQNLIDQQNRVMQDVASGNRYELNAETMALLGLNEGDKTYGVDLNRAIQQANPMDINASNVASAEDYARYLALSDLAGIEPSILQAENAGMAGTAPSLKADQVKLQQDIAIAKDPYLTNLYNTYQLPPLPASAQLRTNTYNGITSSTGTVMTPRQLEVAISDFESNVLPGAPSQNTHDILTSRLNAAKQILADYKSGIGTGSQSTIKTKV